MTPRSLVALARVLLGAWMLGSGLNWFLGPFLAVPTGHQPLAMELMTAFVDSRLIDVAMAIELVSGAWLIAGVLVPVALCVLLPVLVCAAFWSVILEREPLGALLALAAAGLTALLMLAYLPYYRGVLQRRALAVGER